MVYKMIPMVWTFLVLMGAVLYGFGDQITVRTSFSCESRPSGYYADMETGCQVYHMCDGLGRQFSYSCPNTTLFQQRMLICDHWYMVNCSKSEDNYSANLLIGQRDKHFVEDSENDRYIRTPRPDLLSNTHAPEYNVIYRHGRTQSNAFSLKNLGGAVQEEKKEPTPTKISFYQPQPRWLPKSNQNEQNEVKTSDENKFKYVENKFKPVNNFPKKYDFRHVFEQFNTSTVFKSDTHTNTNKETAQNLEFETSSNKFIASNEQASKIPPANKRIDNYSTTNTPPLERKIDPTERILPRKFKYNEKVIKELQKLYFIPNYQFDLESVSRPGYDTQTSSFYDIPNLADN